MALARFLVLLACVVCAGPVFAKRPTLGPDVPAAANSRYAVGVTLYREGKFTEAAREFRLALEIVPDNHRLAYNLARSLERAGELAGALEAYRRYLELNPEADDRDATEAVMRGLREMLAGRGAELELSSNPSGAEAYLDGAAVPAGTTPLTLRLTPGDHRVRVALARHHAEERTLTLEATQRTTLEVALRPIEEESEWRAWVGWGAVGLGAVAIGVGGWSLGSALDAADRADRLAPAEVEEHDRLGEDIDSGNLGAAIGLSAGVVLVGAGVTLLLWPDDPTAVAVGPGGVSWGGVW